MGRLSPSPLALAEPPAKGGAQCFSTISNETPGASFTLQDGLVVLLGADDNFEQFRDHDFNDVVLRCHNTDPALTPWNPPVTILDFTRPKRRRPPPRDPRLGPPPRGASSPGPS